MTNCITGDIDTRDTATITNSKVGNVQSSVLAIVANSTTGSVQPGESAIVANSTTGRVHPGGSATITDSTTGDIDVADAATITNSTTENISAGGSIILQATTSRVVSAGRHLTCAGSPERRTIVQSISAYDARLMHAEVASNVCVKNELSIFDCHIKGGVHAFTYKEVSKSVILGTLSCNSDRLDISASTVDTVIMSGHDSSLGSRHRITRIKNDAGSLCMGDAIQSDGIGSSVSNMVNCSRKYIESMHSGGTHVYNTAPGAISNTFFSAPIHTAGAIFGGRVNYSRQQPVPSYRRYHSFTRESPCSYRMTRKNNMEKEPRIQILILNDTTITDVIFEGVPGRIELNGASQVRGSVQNGEIIGGAASVARARAIALAIKSSHALRSASKEKKLQEVTPRDDVLFYADREGVLPTIIGLTTSTDSRRLHEPDSLRK